MMMKFLSLALLGIQLLSLVSSSQGSIKVLHDAALMRSLSSFGLAPTGESLHVEGIENGDEELVGFGSSALLAAHNSTRLVVGAPMFGVGGAVFVYDYDGSAWGSPVKTILGGIGDRIGGRMSLSANGSRLAVRFKTFVRVFHLDTDEVPHDIPGGGATVTLSYDGSLVAVSAEGFNSFTGRVLLYAQQGDGSYAVVREDGGVPLTFVGNSTLGRFGWATSFNEQGDRLAISAPYHTRDGTLNVGIVRVYEKDGDTWTRLGVDDELAGTQENEGFGLSIALSADGNYLAVGSPGSHEGGTLSGKVSVFKYNDTSATWDLVDSVLGENETDRFGRCVAITENGSRLAASSFAFGNDRGQVVLFDLIGDDLYWIDYDEGDSENDLLGFGLLSISMTADGVHLAAGAYRGLDDDGRRSGQVNVYEYLDEPSYFPPTATPSLAPTTSMSPSLAPSTSAAPTNPSPYIHQIIDEVSDEDTLSTGSSQFGWAIALSEDGDRLVIGAPKLVSDSSTNTTDGGIFMYELINNDTAWNLTWSLTGNEGEKLGNRLSLASNRLALRRHDPKGIEIYNITESGSVVLAGNIPQDKRGDTVTLSPDGAYCAVSQEFHAQGRGLVEVYHDSSGDASNWTLVVTKNLTGTNIQTRYGWATSFSESGDRLAVSAPNFNGAGTKNGLIHIFRHDAGTWSLEKTWTGSQELEQLGFSMVLSRDGTLLAFGSPGNNGGGYLRGQISTFRLVNDEWKEIGSVQGTNDNDRVGRNVALNHNGTLLATTSLFHDALSGQVLVYTYGLDGWRFVDEREGYLPGDRLGFGVTALGMTNDGNRIVTASLATNGTAVAAIRTFDIIDPDDDDYNPNDNDLPEFNVGGCVCNEVRVCLTEGVVPGSTIRLCLNTNNDVITFVGLHELEIVEQDLSKFTYRAIHEGKSEFGTEVSVSQSSAFIETPLMSFFSGDHDCKAQGIAILQYDGDRYVRRRILLDGIEGDFSVDVKVEKANEPQPTSSATTLGVFLVSTMSVTWGLLVIVVV